MSKNKRMTARQFVLNSNKCPACGSGDVDWGSITVEGNSTYQEASCTSPKCGARFVTVSRLVGYIIDGDYETQTIAEDFGEIHEHGAEKHEKACNSVWFFEARTGFTHPGFPVEVWVFSGGHYQGQHLNSYVSLAAALKDYPTIRMAKPGKAGKKTVKP